MTKSGTIILRFEYKTTHLKQITPHNLQIKLCVKLIHFWIIVEMLEIPKQRIENIIKIGSPVS